MGDQNRNVGLPRVLEVGFATLGIVLTAPLLLVSAVLIKLSSRGPVIFRQDRVGKNGESFTLLKLRTMNAGSGALITVADDRRVTVIGKILRRCKIDELPQLWNVVRGEMGIVGPRPEVPEFVNLDDPDWKEILNFRPGLTDPVTLILRNEEQLLADFNADQSFYKGVIQPYKIRGYLNFLRQRTWMTDVVMIGRTITAILLPRTVVPPTKEELQWSLAKLPIAPTK